MEIVLPQEVVSQVLKWLPEVDLYYYSLSSRTSYESAKKVWWIKVVKLYGGSVRFYKKVYTPDKIVSPITKSVYEISHCSAQKMYTHENILRIKISLRTYYTHAVERAKTVNEKMYAIYQLHDFVVENMETIKSCVAFKKFCQTLEERLFELCKQPAFHKGEHYYRILYPESYEERFYPWSGAIENLFV